MHLSVARVVLDDRRRSGSSTFEGQITTVIFCDEGPGAPQSKVSSIQAVITALGPDSDPAVLSSLRGALQRAKESSMPSPNLLAEPGNRLDARVAEAQASVSSPGGIGPVGSRHAELRKASLETTKRQCRVHPVGERLQSCLKFVERAKGTHRKIVEEAQQFLTNLESQLAAGLQDSERLRAEARACAVPPAPHTSPRAKPLNCGNCAKKWNS